MHSSAPKQLIHLLSMSGQATEYFISFKCIRPHHNNQFTCFNVRTSSRIFQIILSAPKQPIHPLSTISHSIYIYIIILFPTSTGCIHTHILPTFIGHLLGPGRTDSVTQIHCMCSVDRILNTQNIFFNISQPIPIRFPCFKACFKGCGQEILNLYPYPYPHLHLHLQ